MIVFHVCSIKKFNHYMRNGIIKAPVRAWETPEEASRFSTQTGRQIIIRLKFPETAKKLDGHKNKARIIHNDYRIVDWFYPSKKGENKNEI